MRKWVVKVKRKGKPHSGHMYTLLWHLYVDEESFHKGENATLGVSTTTVVTCSFQCIKGCKVLSVGEGGNGGFYDSTQKGWGRRKER